MTGTNAGPAFRRAAALTVLLAVWESLSRVGWLDPFYAPPPSAVGGVMLDLAGGELWPHLGATATAALAGLAAGPRHRHRARGSRPPCFRGWPSFSSR